MSQPRTRFAAPRELLNALCSSPIATVVTDPHSDDNPIVAVNAAFEQLTGYAASEIIGRNCRFLAGPETEQEGTSALRDALREARPVLVELLNYKRDGTPFRNAVMIAPFLDEEGRVEHFVGSQMEIASSNPALASPSAKVARTLVARLSPRQRQVLKEMALGYRNKQIAVRLELSEKTVKMHRSALLAKLQALSSTDAVRIAVQAGL